METRPTEIGTSGAAEPAVPRRVSGSRLRQVDTFRLLICFCVLARHSGVAQYAVPVSANYTERPVVGAFTFAGHFTRDVFFFISALVLVHAYAKRLGPDGRLPNAGAVRRKRVRLIGVPFLVWSVIYIVTAALFAVISPLVSTEPAESWSQLIPALPDRLVHALLTGDASYHLYFLVVTIEFTLVFPLFVRFLHRTRGRHGYLLAVSFVVQLITLRCYADLGMPTGTWRSIIGDSSLVAYQFCLVAGGLAGLHLERMHKWLIGHRALVLTALPLATAALLLTYRSRLGWMDAEQAADAMHPVVMVFAAAMLGSLYLAADWLAGLQGRRIRRVLDYGGQLSFGIYLAHPLVLSCIFAIWIQLGWSTPAAWNGVVAVALTLAGTVAFCLVAHRTRFSQLLIGRARWTAPAPVAPEPPVPVMVTADATAGNDR